MRELLRGLIAGLILSSLRAPLGIDVFQWPAVGARTSYGWRAVAIAVIAIGLMVARQARSSPSLLLGVAVGFALHGLLLANAWSPGSHVALGASAAVGGVLLAALRRPREKDAEAEPAPRLLEMIGLAAAGAGTAIAIEGVARHVRLFGAALSQDDSVFALVLLGLVVAGAIAFGWIAAAKGLRGLSLPAGLALSASACFVSLIVISRFSFEKPFTVYLKRFGLDGSLHGTLAYDALVSAACFVAPGLVLGAALPGARGRERILSILVGGALGLCLVPAMLALEPGSTASDVQASSAELIPFGTLLAAGGSVLAILALSDRGALARWSGIAVSFAAAAPVMLREVQPVHVLSPWATRPTYPLLVSDTPAGLVAVESFGILGGSWPFVTLDRRTVTPPVEGIEADLARLRGTFELLPAEVRSRGSLRVLLVGQLTPLRARILAECGATRIDRTAAWFEAMPRIEDALWTALSEASPMPEGTALSPAEAQERFAEGEYDLVLVLPLPGDAPRISGMDAPESTTVVRWLEIDQPAQHRDLGETIALTYAGLDQPAIAVLLHASTAESAPENLGKHAPLLLDGGVPTRAPTPISWLRRRISERSDERTDPARTAMLERLASAASGGPHDDLVTGLSIFHAAQRRSSQFESPEERTELPDACLARFRSAALAGPPEPFVRRLWESLARILVRKRWIEEIYAYLQPVAEKHPPWPELEKALARADLESLEPEDAIRRLEKLAESSPDDFAVWDMLGEARCALGEGEKALESWRRAVQLPTFDRIALRRVSIALARIGDSEGIAAARRLLMETPGDEELMTLLTSPVSVGPQTDPCPQR